MTLLSTMPGKHSGVPNPALLDALERESVLHNTNKPERGVKGSLSTLVTIKV